MSTALARAQHGAQLARKRSTEAVHAIIQRVTMNGTAATLAYADTLGKDGKPNVPTMAGGKVPTKLILAALSYLGAWLTKGALSSAIVGVGDAANAIYTYKAAKGQTVVAGETESDSENDG